MNDPVGELWFDGPREGPRVVVLAHGAGNPADSPFLEAIASGIAEGGFPVVRFEFPYMVRQRREGIRRPPDSLPVLRETWLAVVLRLGPPGRLVIGGKSMGGRIASLVADEAGVGGLICLGYPFHAPGRPDRLRIEHLQVLRTAALIVQGERDPYGSREEVAGLRLSPALRWYWIARGDHSFQPARDSGRTVQECMTEAVEASLAFLRSLGPGPNGGSIR
ncbi:alpha/beta hydrolase [Myxococcota bacterium]|nr:alpha/beta hydrolase [Myxococcota bacterium]